MSSKLEPRSLIIGGLIGSLMTFAALTADRFVGGTIEKSLDNRLVYSGVAFRFEMDTRYIPILGIQFSRRPVQLQLIVVKNAGRNPQRDIRVICTKAGEIAIAKCDPWFPVVSDTGELLGSFDPFCGEEEMRFTIPHLPPDTEYTFLMGTYPGEQTGLPSVVAYSETAKASWSDPSSSMAATVKAMIEHPKLQEADPRKIRRLDWSP